MIVSNDALDSMATELSSASRVEESRLLAILDSYLEQRSRGVVVDHAALVQQHPEFADELPGLLRSIDALHGFYGEGSRDQSPRNESLGWKDLSDTVVGDYRVLREVGRGGMGVVYEAHQISLDRKVALKVLPLSVVLDQQQIARFTVEAHAAAQLHHPNIVPIYSIGCEGGLHCYSMPLIEGQSLDRIIVETCGADTSSITTPQYIDRSVDWMLQAAEALDHAHAHGVIHRDIKPSNLMIDETGKLWVTDFGLARCPGDSNLTQSGAVIGTWRYMSPEQASGGSSIVDHRSDIYALGRTFLETLVGKPAVPQASMDETGVALHSKLPKPQDLRKMNSGVCRDLETIVMKTIEPDAADRYQSCRELADDLRRLSSGQPILARRPSLVDRIFKWTLRHRRAVCVAIILCAISLVGSFSAAVMFANQSNRLTAALTHERQRFEQVREVLDHFGLMAAERLRGVPGAEAVREDLVRDLLVYYDEFASEASDSPELIVALAKTHLRAATIIDELGAGNQALTAYERAAMLYQEVVAGEFCTDDAQFQLGVCLNNMGILQAELGDQTNAEQSYTAAMRIYRDVLIEHPGAQRELAKAFGNLGLLHAAQDDNVDAERYLLESLRLQSAGVAKDAKQRLAIAITLNNLGFLFQELDPERALEYNDKAIKSLENTQDTDVPSDNVELQRQLAVSLNNRAALLAKLERQDEAFENYQSALAVYREVIQSQPYRVSHREDAAITYNNFGRLLSRTGRESDAQRALQQAAGLLGQLIELRPQEYRYRASLGGILNNLGKSCGQAGDHASALRHFQRSATQLSELPEEIAREPVYREVLSASYANYEQSLRRDGQRADAEQVALLRAAMDRVVVEEASHE